MKRKTKAQLAADAAFVAKLASITFGTGAKIEHSKNPPDWVPKVIGPDGKPMKCLFAAQGTCDGESGTLAAFPVNLTPTPPDPGRNDDSFAA